MRLLFVVGTGKAENRQISGLLTSDIFSFRHLDPPVCSCRPRLVRSIKEHGALGFRFWTREQSTVFIYMMSNSDKNIYIVGHSLKQA